MGSALEHRIRLLRYRRFFFIANSRNPAISRNLELLRAASGSKSMPG